MCTYGHMCRIGLCMNSIPNVNVTWIRKIREFQTELNSDDWLLSYSDMCRCTQMCTYGHMCQIGLCMNSILNINVTCITKIREFQTELNSDDWLLSYRDMCRCAQMCTYGHMCRIGLCMNSILNLNVTCIRKIREFQTELNSEDWLLSNSDMCRCAQMCTYGHMCRIGLCMNSILNINVTCIRKIREFQTELFSDDWLLSYSDMC